MSTCGAPCPDNMVVFCGKAAGHGGNEHCGYDINGKMLRWLVALAHPVTPSSVGGCVCDLWQYGVSLGERDDINWWDTDLGANFGKLTDALCACGHKNGQHSPTACTKNPLGAGKQTMASIPPQPIMADKHGPYIIFQNRIYRPTPSVDSPGTDVRALNKIRQATEGTKFPVGKEFAVSQAHPAGTDENYLVVNTRDKAFGPTGLREVWCQHRIPDGSNPPGAESDRYWHPIGGLTGVEPFVIPNPPTLPNMGIEIPTHLIPFLPRTIQWMRDNIKIPTKGKKK